MTVVDRDRRIDMAFARPRPEQFGFAVAFASSSELRVQIGSTNATVGSKKRAPVGASIGAAGSRRGARRAQPTIRRPDR